MSRTPIFASAALLGLLFPVALAEVTGPSRVIDGDTLDIFGERIRIHDIDAPEMGQTCRWPDQTIKCGEIAKAAMLDLVSGMTVTCEEKDRDRYGRIVALCKAGGFDIGANMIQTGWALAYREFSIDCVGNEEKARPAKRGLNSGSAVHRGPIRRALPSI